MKYDCHGRSLDILLVEDELGEVTRVREAIQELGAPVQLSVVSDGAQALAYLRRQGPHAAVRRPELVLLGLTPRTAGLEVLREIKRDTELQRIPVFILTTSDAPDDIDVACNLEASCYITKPDDPNDYRQMMDSLVLFCLKIIRLGGSAPSR